MAVIGIGVDVCDIARWQQMAHRRPGAVDAVLTPAEAVLPASSQAARFAAKEALAKALRDTSGLRWHDAEVVRDPLGAPGFVTTGTVARRLADLGATRVHLSLSHDGGIATAFVVVEGDR